MKNIARLLSIITVIATCYLNINAQGRWEWASPRSTSNDLFSVRVFDSLTIWAFGEAGTMIHSDNFGDDWKVYYDHPVTENIYSSYFFNDHEGIIVCQDGGIYYTWDKCISWEKVESGTYEDLLNINFYKNGNGIITGF